MNKKYIKIGFAIFLGLYAGVVNSADVNAGKAKAAVCQGCHGSNGVSVNPQWPNLAAQTADYLNNQLLHFKSGERENPMMGPMAKGLTEDEIHNLAAYFAGLPAKPAAGASAAPGKESVAMCMGCHGDNLAGKLYVPRLAGQNAQYLIKQLHDFKSGARKGGPMTAIAKNLSEEEINKISTYISSIPN